MSETQVSKGPIRPTDILPSIATIKNPMQSSDERQINELIKRPYQNNNPIYTPVTLNTPNKGGLKKKTKKNKKTIKRKNKKTIKRRNKRRNKRISKKN